MRWIFRIALTLVTLAVVAVGALFLIPSDRIAGLAAQQFEAATGRALTISGDVSPTIFPRLGVAAEGVTIANAVWSDQGPMLRAERLDVGVDFMALIGGTVDVKRLQIVRPDIILERAADGRANWEMAPPQTSKEPSGASAGGTTAAPSESSTLPPISIALAEITDGSLTYIDGAAGRIERLAALDLTARVPSLFAPITAEGSALYNGAAVAITGEVESLESLISGALTPVDISMISGGTNIAVKGRFGLDPLGFDGAVIVKSAERAQILAALGQVVPDLPAGLGRDNIEITGDLTLASEGSVHLRGMTLNVDGNVIKGDVDVLTSGPRPKVIARLTAGALDLRGLSQQGRAAEGKAPTSGPGWSTERIDVSALSVVDADVTLSTGALSLGDATIDRLVAKVALDAGRAVATLDAVELYGGTIAGQVIVNGRNGLSSRVNVALSGLQTAPFLTEFIDYDRLVGEVNGAVNVLAIGNSMDALMKSLDGEGRFSMGKGELLGLDLAGMLRNLDTSYRGSGQSTIFDGVNANFALTDGVLRNDDLAFSAPFLAATGAGEVGIGGQTLNYRVVPEIMRGENDIGISVPVLITGTWANPKFRPDLESLFDRELEKEKAALKARADAEEARLRERAKAEEAAAKEAARAKIAAELNVDAETITDTDSIEDAVKKKLEDELKGALGGLLGGN